MSLEEGLQEIVGVFGDHLFAAVVFCSVGKSNSRRLVQPQDMGCFSPAERIHACTLTIGIYAARAVLGEKGQSRRATRSPSEPNDERDFLLGNILILVALFEHPEEEMFVLSVLIVLGSLDVHVTTDGLGAGITDIGVILVLLEVMNTIIHKLEEARGTALENARGQILGLTGGNTDRRHCLACAPNTRVARFIHGAITLFFVAGQVARGGFFLELKSGNVSFALGTLDGCKREER